MSWEELYELAEAGDPVAMEAYLIEHPEPEPERPGFERLGVYRRATDPVNMDMLAVLVRRLPLDLGSELTFAEELGRDGDLEPLTLLSPLAAIHGAIQAHDTQALDTALYRNPERNGLIRLLVNLMGRGSGEEWDYQAAQHVVNYIQRRYVGDKAAVYSKLLRLLFPAEQILAPLTQFDLAAQLLRYGARLSREDLSRITRYVARGVSNIEPVLEQQRNLLLALYEAGAAAYIPPYVQEHIFQDGGYWVLVRHPAQWGLTARDLAHAAERTRAGLRTALPIILSGDLVRYVLQAL